MDDESRETVCACQRRKCGAFARLLTMALFGVVVLAVVHFTPELGGGRK